jgi:mannose-1-phosphate guanylyltransferase
VDTGKYPELWAIILAGGDGRRLRALVEQLDGVPLPKQFAPLGGSASLLQRTMARVGAVAPPRRTVVVVSDTYEELARDQLAPWPDARVVAQPRNCGTAPGILLPLSHVLAAAPHATVAIFPSDHHVPRPRPFLEAVVRAYRSGCTPLTLLGIEATEPDTTLGWIVPAKSVKAGMAPVEQFVEKPSREMAETLMGRGGLWNSLVCVGPARSIWQLAERCIPEVTERFSRPARDVYARYATMPVADFSRCVLERAPGLMVAPVEGSGWSDWGTPERVLAGLREAPSRGRSLLMESSP